jgi:hypothetical protein
MVSDLRLEYLAGHAMAQAMFPFTFGMLGDARGGREGGGLGTGIGVRWRETLLILTAGHTIQSTPYDRMYFFCPLIIFRFLTRQHRQI